MFQTICEYLSNLRFILLFLFETFFFIECGPCGSRSTCPVCMEAYIDNELIIQCVQCERWLHGFCDGIANEADAEICADKGKEYQHITLYLIILLH